MTRIAKGFWGGHIDLDHVAHVGPLIIDKYSPPYFEITLMLCDCPLRIFKDYSEGYMERNRLEFVEQWKGVTK